MMKSGQINIHVLKMVVLLFLLLLLSTQPHPTLAQMASEENTDFTVRTTNSVDIQVCASSVLSNERDSVQASIIAQIKLALDSTGVYYTRAFSTNAGGVCFLYVYQASSPSMARNAVPILLTNSNNNNNNGAVFSVQYNGFDLGCSITAVPWQGEGYGPFGPDIPWQWTGSDVIMWGGCIAGTLVFCILGMCCLVRISASQERQRADKILLMDKRLIRDLVEVAHDIEKQKKHQGKKPKASESTTTDTPITIKHEPPPKQQKQTHALHK
jgi:hypothetical protein